MKPKRVPWPRRKKTLVWSLTAALLVVVLMAGHFLCFTPGQAIRAAESHAGTGPTQVVMEGAVGNVPLYLSQNHRAWMVTPFRMGLFYDWRNNGQPLMVIDRSGDPAGVTAGALHFWDGNSDQSQFHLLGYVDLPGAASVVARCTHTAPSSEYTALELTAAIPQTGETAGYFWETVTLPGGTTYLHPDQLTVLDQAGHPLCTYDLTNHWGYASYPLSETR